MSQDVRWSLCDEDIERITEAAAKAFEVCTGMTREEHLEQHRYLLEEIKLKQERRQRLEKIYTNVVGSLTIATVLAVYKFAIHPVVVPIGEAVLEYLRRH